MRKIVMTLLLAVACARADTLFTLDNPIQTGAPGGTLTFTGTLFNDDVVDVFFNAASATLPYSELSVDFTDFFTLIPLSLSAGGSYSGPIFDVDITNAVAPGDYFGSFTIQGGPDDATINDLATENFQITVSDTSSVPEPSTFWLVFTTVVLLTAVGSFRNAKRRTIDPSG